MDEITLQGGKYTVHRMPDGNVCADRYGEAWRPLTGDKLMLAMFDRIVELEAQLAAAQKAAEPTRSGVMLVGTDRIFADIRAAYVKPDGSIERTLNGSTMPPGTDLYVLGDLII